MDVVELNLALVDTLQKWDPLRIGEENYETEIADVIQAVHKLTDEEKLAKEIQFIYEFSYEQIIPLQSCKSVAKQLLSLKEISECQ
ncbi:DUF1871 family protein [Mangrovibacillus cuniculi]|uniref:DUF1871 family protein n=1 Tax=Mangrovibacillus cuniculi TaxID=2593652 RepID=A0A7S8CCJ4_9BACI|nr:DUF1871 family protein [Mangrovibacillus cuniculi]QPC47336.1 DUF1871 family protein [Mangrovibacillus cuniculi]